MRIAVLAVAAALAMVTPAPARAESGFGAPTVEAAGVTRTRIPLGDSIQGRGIVLHRICGARPTKQVLVVGAIHGREDDGIPIVRRLAADGVPDRDVCLLLVPTMNPDGDAAQTRQNARGVDLNRNFPGGLRTGRPWDTFYGGRSDLSERESRLLHDLIRRTRPTALIVYHQRMNLVDFGGGNRALVDRYAAAVGMRSTVLTRHPGSMATWTHSVLPGTTVVTVELPASVSGVTVGRHVRAVLDLTTQV